MVNFIFKIKRIFFPFFDTKKHSFLFKKSWIGWVVVVIYLIIMVKLLLIVSLNLFPLTNEDVQVLCQTTPMQLLDDVFTDNNTNILKCETFYLKVLPNVLTFASFLIILVWHYIIQFIFFKILLNLIFLKNKTNE